MRVLFILIVIATFIGCHIVEINLVQRQIVDVGDNTKDGYTTSDSKLSKEETNMKFVVPLK